MLFSKSSLLAIAAIAGLASAVSSSIPTSTPQGSVKAHVVTVSDTAGDLTFTPDTIIAAAGDLVQFHFYPKNHSVAQSTFANPCEPMPLTNGTEGFWSGFMPVTAQDTTMPVFSVLVKDTNPVWFYCATGKHCQAGMAGVINPPASTEKTLALYKSAAASVALTGIPNTAAGTGGDNNATDGGSGSATPPTSTGSSSATNTSTGLPDVATSTGTNAGSTLVASSAFALVAAAVAAVFTF